MANHLLHEASQAGDGAAIAEHSRAVADLQKQIDARFDELEKATIEHDWSAREYDERLQALERD